MEIKETFFLKHLTIFNEEKTLRLVLRAVRDLLDIAV